MLTARRFFFGERKRKHRGVDADLSSATRTGKFAAAFRTAFNAALRNEYGRNGGRNAACGKSPLSQRLRYSARAEFMIWYVTVSVTETHVKLALTHAGLTVGEDGAPHQSWKTSPDECLPNMTASSGGCTGSPTGNPCGSWIDGRLIRLGRSKSMWSTTILIDRTGKIQVEASGTTSLSQHAGSWLQRRWKQKKSCANRNWCGGFERIDH